MSKLKNFKANEINAANIKGGNFCEWYINQRTSEGKTIASGQLNKAMELDAILATEGEAAAMAQGGAEFIAKL